MASGIGGSGSERLDMISVSPNDPPPAAGTQFGSFGDLPGSGSYGDPISGLHGTNAAMLSSIQQVSQAGAAATAQTAATFQNQNLARGTAQQAQFSVNMAAATAQAQRLFAPPTITGPILPPAVGPAFGLAGPAPTPGVQDRSEPATPPAQAQAAAAASAPAAAAGPPVSPVAGQAISAGIGQALGRAAQFAGGTVGRAIPLVNTVRTILDSSPAQAPGIDPRLAASPFYANGQPRVIPPGAPAADPTATADPEVAPWLQSLAKGFTIPTPPDSLTPPAAFTPITGGAVAPLPGFTQAPVLSGYEGYTQIAPGIFAPLPGFDSAPAQPFGIPGLTAAGQMPALPGFGASEIDGTTLLQNSVIPGTLTGSLNDLTSEERLFIQEQLVAGVNVTIIPRSIRRTADFFLNGVRTELKTVSQIRNHTETGLSAAIARNLLDARGRSGTVIIDARKQPGMTLQAANRAIARGIARDDQTNPRLVDVTIKTPQGDAKFHR